MKRLIRKADFADSKTYSNMLRLTISKLILELKLGKEDIEKDLQELLNLIESNADSHDIDNKIERIVRNITNESEICSDFAQTIKEQYEQYEQYKKNL